MPAGYGVTKVWRVLAKLSACGTAESHERGKGMAVSDRPVAPIRGTLSFVPVRSRTVPHTRRDGERTVFFEIRAIFARSVRLSRGTVIGPPATSSYDNSVQSDS